MSTPGVEADTLAPALTSRGARAVLFSSACLAVIALSFGEVVCRGGFVSDDFVRLEALGRGELSLFPGRFSGGLGFVRPLLGLTYVLEHALWGSGPAGYHATNVLMHLAAALLVGRVGLLLARRAGAAAAGSFAVPALLFLALPSHSEPVSWVTGRSDLLAAVLGLLALAFYLEGAIRPSRALLAAALAAFALSLLAKESALCLPGVLCLAELLGLGGEGGLRGAASRLAPHGAVLGLYLGLRRALLGSFTGGYGGIHLDMGPGRLLDNLGGLSLRALLPPLPRWSEDPSLLAAVSACGAAVCLGAAALLVLGLARGGAARRPALAAGAFALSLAPVLTLGLRLASSEGERYVYLPSAFAVLGLAPLVARTRRWAMALAAALLVAAPAVSLHRAGHDWVEAARLAGKAASTLAAGAPSGRVLVLNVPDNLRGAYVLRNGLRQAVRMAAGSGRRGRIKVVSFHEIGSPSDRVAVSRVEGGFLLRTSGPESSFRRVRSFRGVRGRLKGPRAAVIRLRSMSRWKGVYAWSGGELLPAPGCAPPGP